MVEVVVVVVEVMHNRTSHRRKTVSSCTCYCTHHSAFCQMPSSHISLCNKSQCTCICGRTFRNSTDHSSHSHTSSCSSLALCCSSNDILLETCCTSSSAALGIDSSRVANWFRMSYGLFLCRMRL